MVIYSRQSTVYSRQLIVYSTLLTVDCRLLTIVNYLSKYPAVVKLYMKPDGSLEPEGKDDDNAQR